MHDTIKKRKTGKEQEVLTKEAATIATVEVNGSNGYTQKSANLDDRTTNEVKNLYPHAQVIQLGVMYN